MTLTLNTTLREQGEKKLGFVPAVLYAKGFENKNVFVANNDFIKIFRQSGESGIINLEGAVNEQVLVHALERNPVTYQASHIDFKVVAKGEKVHVNVPLVFVGDAPAVKLGANLVKVMHEISIEADANSIPHEINVDVASLVNLDSNITVGQLKLPKGVSLYHVNSEDIVISVVSQVEEDLSNPVSQIDMNAVGTSVEKGKKESEE